MTKYRVFLKDITMIFGSLVANDKVNLKVKPNEIHGLIGENGAGKSTLMSILFGLLKPTSGSIYFNDELQKIKDPNIANALGIGMVQQHFQLVEDLTVLENIVLGNEPGLKGLVSLEVGSDKVKEIIKKYGFEVDLKKFVYECSVAEQQKIEILKMLYLESDVLIFDEPSAVLVPEEIDNLLESLRNLKKLGKTIILITHKLNEIKAVCDNATVLRKGSVVATYKVKDVSIKEMATMMVGREVIESKNTLETIGNKLVLDVKDVTSVRIDNPKAIALNAFSFKAYSGEILAIAGVEGNGQRELFEILLGIHKPSDKDSSITYFPENETSMEGIDLLKQSVKKRYRWGISFVPLNRHKDAMIPSFNIRQNLVLNLFQYRPYSTFGILKNKAIKAFSRNVIENYDVRGVNESMTTSLGALSGGNQQKAIVGREMSKSHNLLILFQPTRGLDVGAIQHIHRLVLEEKEKGKCILLISYELDEILALADRVLALSSGVNKGILDKNEISRERVGSMIAGQHG